MHISNCEELVHSARAPITKSTDNYSKRFNKKKKNSSINYSKNKEKLSSTATRHARTSSRMNILPTPNSVSNIVVQKQRVPSKRQAPNKKPSKSNPRKESKSSHSKSKSLKNL